MVKCRWQLQVNGLAAVEFSRSVFNFRHDNPGLEGSEGECVEGTPVARPDINGAPVPAPASVRRLVSELPDARPLAIGWILRRCKLWCSGAVEANANTNVPAGEHLVWC